MRCLESSAARWITHKGIKNDKLFRKFSPYNAKKEREVFRKFGSM